MNRMIARILLVAVIGSLATVNAPGQAQWVHLGTNSGGNLTFGGNGGLAGGTYYVLVSTDLTMPAAQWTVVATNTFDANGNFMFVNPLDPMVPETFFQLALPPP